MSPDKPSGTFHDPIERPRNQKELAQLLGVTVKVIRLMIKSVKAELGEPLGGVYCVKQVLFMVEKFGAKK